MMRSKRDKVKVWLVQKGVWDMPKESMPLAIAYLKSTAMANEILREHVHLEIFNFGGGDDLVKMANRLFGAEVPDVLAFSVLGWSYRAFGALAETFKQLNPQGWVIFGGTHVANQANRILREFPYVDVIVNCEGEFVFKDIILSYLSNKSYHDLLGIEGISFRDALGMIITAPNPPRIADLSSIPSPILTHTIPLLDHSGQFRYDVALMETNRGCPYSCSFCYWGGATGQKVRAFPRERLREELEVFAFHQVHTIVLCDSNFGMFQSDMEFVEDLIHTKEKYGYPRALETSWAKNKSKMFYSIVQTLRKNDLQSSFTLALQTLSDTALTNMRRRNMRVNEWEGLAEWLNAQDLQCYAELIWGAPGETYDSFLAGYDRLARFIPRIAAYPLLLIPNTNYSDNREQYGFVTVRGEQDDFEYVIAHKDMTIADNQRMQRFLLWARAIAENLVLRNIWVVLYELTDITQSQVLLSMATWFEQCQDPAARGLNLEEELLGRPSTLITFLKYLYTGSRLEILFEQWWIDEMECRFSPSIRQFLSEVFRYDWLTKPIYCTDTLETTGQGMLEVVKQENEVYYVRKEQKFDYDIPALINAIRQRSHYSLEKAPITVDIWYKAGFINFIDNHELAAHFIGQPRMREGACTTENVAIRHSSI